MSLDPVRSKAIEATAPLLAGTSNGVELDVENCLKKTNLFNCLNSFQLSRLGRAVIIKRYKKDALIFSAGEPALGFYIVVEGKVKIYKLSAQGKEYILNMASSADTIAEVTVFSGKDYPAYAQAVTNSTLFFLPKEGFLRLLKEYPEIALRMLGAMAKRQRGFADIIEDLSLRDVESRLSKYLLNLAQEAGVNIFKLDLQKSDLAMKLATIPETLSRNLKKLKSKRIISLKDRTITILNKEALKKLAQEGL